MPPPAKPGTQIVVELVGVAGVDGNALVHRMKAPPWSDVADAVSRMDSAFPTPCLNAVASVDPTVSVPVSLGVPVHVEEFRKTLKVRVNVTPAGAANTFTLPSVNVACAVHLDVWPVAVARNCTPMSWVVTRNSRFVKVPWPSAVTVRLVSGSPLDSRSAASLRPSA